MRPESICKIFRQCYRVLARTAVKFFDSYLRRSTIARRDKS
jgi:hypothetical protein